MTVNDKAGKTEAVCTFFGPHSEAEAHAAKARTHLKVENELYGTLKVQIVTRYKHLGSYNTGPFRLEYEAHIRAAQCKSAFKQLRRNLFANKHFSTHRRLCIWKSLCMSKLLHHTGIWGLPTHEDYGPMQPAYHQGPRVIAGCSNVGKSSTNEEIRVSLHLPPLEDVIMRRRLGLSHGVLRTQSEWLLGLAMATRTLDRGWTAQAIQGLATLHAHEPGETPTQTHQLQGIARDTPQRWKARLKRHEQMQLLRHATEQDQRTLEQYQQEAFATVGISVGRQEPITLNECPKCAQTFATPQGMRRQYVSAHDGMHVANLYAAGDTCPSCLTTFRIRHTRSAYT